jgi:hypothetical protein
MSLPPAPIGGWRPTARADVAFRQVGEDWILFDPGTLRIHPQDVLGALVWSLCDGTRDVKGIEAAVRDSFGIARKDPPVAETLRGFLDAGLLEADGPGSGPAPRSHGQPG